MRPPSLPPETRAYYREVWGFDPLTDAQKLPRGDYYYQQDFSLNADPYLQAAGVQVSAVVEVYEGQSINKIRFDRGNRSRAIECTHTIVHVAPAANAFTFADDLALKRALSDADKQLLEETGGPVQLPPWEHFAALKSFVGGISALGLGNVLQTAWEREFTTSVAYPFGFNIEMQRQVIGALAWVAPQAAQALVRDFFLILTENVPPEWLNSRASLLAETFNLGDVFLSDPAAFALVEDKFSPSIWRDLAMVHGKSHPSIQARITALCQHLPVETGAWVGTNAVVEWLASHPDQVITAFPHDLSLGFVDITDDYGEIACFSNDWWGSNEEYHDANFAEDFKDVTWIVGAVVEDPDEYVEEEPTWPSNLEHDFATLLEIAQHSPPDCFTAALGWLDEFLDFAESLCEHVDFFARVDELQESAALRVMAALPVHDNPTLLTYLANVEREDIGVLTLALHNPLVRPRDKKEIQDWREEFLHSRADRLWYCGKSIARLEALALAHSQDEAKGEYFLPDDFFCLEQLKTLFTITLFEAREGHVVRRISIRRDIES